MSVARSLIYNLLWELEVTVKIHESKAKTITVNLFHDT